jgi:hypothetical protein
MRSFSRLAISYFWDIEKNDQFQILEFKIIQFDYYSFWNKSSDYRLEMEYVRKKDNGSFRKMNVRMLWNSRAQLNTRL